MSSTQPPAPRLPNPNLIPAMSNPYLPPSNPNQPVSLNELLNISQQPTNQQSPAQYNNNYGGNDSNPNPNIHVSRKIIFMYLSI